MIETTQMSSLHEERLDHACNVLIKTGARRILDLGCGSGSLIHRLLRDSHFEEIVGVEQSGLSLSQARRMLETFGSHSTTRVRLRCASYTEKDNALCGFDAAAMIETIEHVPPNALSRVETAVFGHYRPVSLFMTTPNSEYNPLFGLAPGEFRDDDHKLEWNREKFSHWARGVAKRNGYRVAFGGIGDHHPDLGHPTQTALFTLLTR